MKKCHRRGNTIAQAAVLISLIALGCAWAVTNLGTSTNNQMKNVDKATDPSKLAKMYSS